MTPIPNEAVLRNDSITLIRDPLTIGTKIVLRHIVGRHKLVVPFRRDGDALRIAFKPKQCDDVTGHELYAIPPGAA